MKRFVLFLFAMAIMCSTNAQTAKIIDNGGLKLEVKLSGEMYFRDIINGTTNIIVEYHSGKKGKDVVYDVARFNADSSRQYAFLSRGITTNDTDDTLQRMYNFIRDGHGFIILTVVIRENGKIGNVKFGLQ